MTKNMPNAGASAGLEDASLEGKKKKEDRELILLTEKKAELGNLGGKETAIGPATSCWATFLIRRIRKSGRFQRKEVQFAMLGSPLAL